MARRQSSIQRQINNNAGPRRNMNGAGVGARLVTRRKANGRADAGKAGLGSRRQRYSDLRAAFGLSPG